jgi:hypothetical protein
VPPTLTLAATRKNKKKPLKIIILAPSTLVATRKHQKDQNRTKKRNLKLQ